MKEQKETVEINEQEYAANDPMGALLALADTPTTKDVETEIDGKKFKFTLKRMSSMKDLNAETKKMRGRMAMLKAAGKVGVEVDPAFIQPFLMKLDDVEAKGDKSIFYLTSKEAVAIATQIEGCVVGMDWPTAALYTRTQATLAIWLNGQVNEMNNLGALDEAKNDWDAIPDES